MIGSVWSQVNYEDMCLSYAVPEVMGRLPHLRYASTELLDVFKRNHNQGHQIEWQVFGAATGIGYHYPAFWSGDDNIEVRLR